MTPSAVIELEAALDTWLDASARLAGLELTAASRAVVRDNLALLLTLSTRFTDTALEPDLEPAPVFRP
jgi:hypothetical protein